MFGSFQQIQRSKLIYRCWLAMIAVVIGFAIYALYHWLWLGEALIENHAIIRALFITFLAALLVGKLIWKNRKRPWSKD